MNPSIFTQIALIEIVKVNMWQILVGMNNRSTARVSAQNDSWEGNTAVWMIVAILDINATLVKIIDDEVERFIVRECRQKFTFSIEIGENCCHVRCIATALPECIDGSECGEENHMDKIIFLTFVNVKLIKFKSHLTSSSSPGYLLTSWMMSRTHSPTRRIFLSEFMICLGWIDDKNWNKLYILCLHADCPK